MDTTPTRITAENAADAGISGASNRFQILVAQFNTPQPNTASGDSESAFSPDSAESPRASTKTQGERRFSSGVATVCDEAPPESQQKQVYTYFIMASGLSRVKIGRAFNPELRLKELQVGCPGKLEIIGTMPGDMELVYHRRFAEYRDVGEWFRVGPELASFLVTQLNWKIPVSPAAQSALEIHFDLRWWIKAKIQYQIAYPYREYVNDIFRQFKGKIIFYGGSWNSETKCLDITVPYITEEHLYQLRRAAVSFAAAGVTLKWHTVQVRHEVCSHDDALFGGGIAREL